jgi:hypothetical protein
VVPGQLFELSDTVKMLFFPKSKAGLLPLYNHQENTNPLAAKTIRRVALCPTDAEGVLDAEFVDVLLDTGVTRAGTSTICSGWLSFLGGLASQPLGALRRWWHGPRCRAAGFYDADYSGAMWRYGRGGARQII